MASLITFLRGRNVPEEVLKRLEEDHIDLNAAKAASKDELIQYGLKVGDYFALRGFIESQAGSSSISCFDDDSVPSFSDDKIIMKEHLLKRFLDRKRDLTSTPVVPRRSFKPQERMKICEKNVKKGHVLKKVSLGWKHYDHLTKRFVTIREGKKGGGTRICKFDINIDASTILKTAKNLFFPNKKSFFGTSESMLFELGNFKEEFIKQDNFKLSEYIEEHKLAHVRLYLMTKSVFDLGYFEDDSSDDSDFTADMMGNLGEEKKQPKEDGIIHKDSTEETKFVQEAKTLKRESRALRVGAEPGLSEDHVVIKLTHPIAGEKTRIFSAGVQVNEIYDWAGSLCDEPEYFCLFSERGPLEGIQQVLTNAEIRMEECTAAEMMSVSNEVNFHGFGEKVDYKIVRRSHVVQDLLAVFKESYDVDLTMLRLMNYHGNLEDGCGFGLIRECFSMFWKTFSENHLDGFLEMVPLTTTGLSKDDWVSVGHMIIYGIKEIGYFPLNICRYLLLQWFNCETNSEDLFASLMNYVSPDEKQALETYIQNEMKDDMVDEEVLLEIIDGLGGRFALSSSTFKVELLKLAEAKFVQGPAFITNIMKTLITKSGIDMNSERLKEKFNELRPSVASMLKLLAFQEIKSKEEHNAAEYLKRFIRSLSTENLAKFLQLLTGADIIVVDQISVNFIDVTGFRKPMFRTCAPIIDLPINYRDYTDFKHEFLSILSAGNDFGMP